ncbi:DUF2076 family protein [Dyella sp. C11]|uniref:DUF2076 domain-containing protein n=1 Tax=Dyella sp. C11 TaxID=2126991 RepID=UPI000D65013B|nr:DUF2076 family protein [Dyella sp. C11]
MTPQEQQLLDDFLQRLAAAGSVAKDPQADALIHQRLSMQPDALYLLVQRSLLQQQALEGAKAQIAQLQAQVANQQGGGSFLGGQQSAWGAVPPPVPPQQAMPQQPMPQQTAPSWRDRLFGGAPAQAAPAVAPSFLSQAATTAAGVAGGMILFVGIAHLLGGHHGGGGFFGGGGQPPVIENITENNTYNDDGRDRFDENRNFDDNRNRDDFASNDFSPSNDFDDSNDGGFDDNGWA